MKSYLANYYSGTSGLLLPVRNKLFYPEEFKDKSRLCFYSSIMNSIEVNSSFYKVPMASTVKKWAEDVPETFRFTFKLSKEITHNKELAFDPQAVSAFMEVIAFVGDKRGCVLVQFPPSVRIGNLKQLELLMSVLRKSDPHYTWNIALEFRHVSLYSDVVYRLLEDYRMAMVIQDKPPAVTPMMESELPFVYLRFHGPGGSYRGSYEDELLYEYAAYINDWISEGKTVYSYFNNTMGEAIGNLFTLSDLVGTLALNNN
ncbi:DUF72 domain-containing protein [Pedobacter panaciterrae]|jgi:Uncharacterized conserved protein|uniref:DUF72 domain-containing protein n=1 Tax=Pedobacter panaciterrae TaxID=363849 RepID=UPI00155DDD6B|nr:DUF72 domain-containing protein [Pedobacter panaciterrae]NQX52461.1 DUF72 domain-containing protein [Pedobacter panaciterrae]